MNHVVLVPGFLGFQSLGKLTYFEGVKDLFEREASVPLNVTTMRTLPTSSLASRARALADYVAALPEGDVHLLGHSTGGLDARLAAQLLGERGRQVTSIVTIATPHQGTPLAEFFASSMGQPTLKVFASIAHFVVTRGSLPLRLLFRLADFSNRTSAKLGWRSRFLDQLFDRLLRDLPESHRKEIEELFAAIAEDTSLVFQLTGEGLDVLNVASRLSSSIKAGSVVTIASPPRGIDMAYHLRDPYAFASFSVYRVLYAFSSRGECYDQAPLNYQKLFLHSFGRYPMQSDSDGVVPTLSQCWREPIAAVWSDHLDVVGHYGGGRAADIMPSRSDFGDEDFDRVWKAVLDFCLG